jgi:hypothetical protein
LSRAAAALLLVGALGAAACRGRGETFLTYFSGEYAVSLEYPATWRGEQSSQEGVWFRHFQPPASLTGGGRLSATLLVAPRTSTLDEYAGAYLQGAKVTSTRDDSRQGARGRAFAYLSADGRTESSLLLLQDGPRIYGLLVQGDPPLVAAHRATLARLQRSLALERPAHYPEHARPRFGYSLRVPPSWKESREFSGEASHFVQFTSPPLLAEKEGATVHAFLAVSVEAAPDGDDLDAFYEAQRRKLGEAFVRLNHLPWNRGYLDVLSTETQVSASRSKRFYRVGGGRGYSLTCEAREDAYPRITAWCDIIASTLKIGGEATP